MIPILANMDTMWLPAECMDTTPCPKYSPHEQQAHSYSIPKCGCQKESKKQEHTKVPGCIMDQATK